MPNSSQFLSDNYLLKPKSEFGTQRTSAWLRTAPLESRKLLNGRASELADEVDGLIHEFPDDEGQWTGVIGNQPYCGRTRVNRTILFAVKPFLRSVMTIANDFVGQRAALENTCETLSDRVLRMCDEWLATDARTMRVDSGYSQTMLDGTAPTPCFREL